MGLSMKIICVSASNVEPFRTASASTHACQIIADLCRQQQPVEVEILALMDYEPAPCRMCGQCLKTGLCCRDEAFNTVYRRMQAADAVFWVVPHYAPFPSKVMMILEKLQEITYLNTCQDETVQMPLMGKPLGIVGHGGQGPEAIPYYLENLVKPLAVAFAGAQMKIIGAGPDSKYGAAFGITSLTMPEGEIFCKIAHDWQDVRSRLQPLTQNVLAATA